MKGLSRMPLNGKNHSGIGALLLVSGSIALALGLFGALRVGSDVPDAQSVQSALLSTPVSSGRSVRMSMTESSTEDMVIGVAVAPSPVRSVTPTSESVMLDGQRVEVRSGVALIHPLDGIRAAKILAEMGSEVLFEGTRSGYWRVTVPAGQSLESFIARLERDDATFDVVRPEGLARACALDTSSATYYSYQWNLQQMHWTEAIDEYEDVLGELDAVLVAIIDSGVAYEDHQDALGTYVMSPDLAASAIYPGPDYVDGDAHPNDVSGHGTHLANVIAAQGGTFGVAPGVSLMPIRILNDENAGAEVDLVEAIYYAVDQGVDIVNLSLSFPPGFFPSAALADAIQYADDRDVLVVAASGNDGASEVSYPAAYATVLAVGASRLTEGDMAWIADYSNVGTALDLVAPGGVGDLDVNDDGQPDGIPGQSIEPGNPSVLHYYLMAGTSQATAHVAGAAAWLRAEGANVDEMRAGLINTSAGTWGRRSFAQRLGLGVVNLNGALEEFEEDDSDHSMAKQYYVNVLSLLYEADGKVGGSGLIRVINERGEPAKQRLVAGHWFGSDSTSFAVVTNKDGIAYVGTEALVPAGSPGMFGLQVDRVMDGKRRVAAAPISFYYLTHGSFAAFEHLFFDESVSDATLLFTVAHGDSGMPEWVADSYVSKAVGAVNAYAPMSIAFNQAVLDGIATLDQGILKDVTFTDALEFGWGASSTVSLTLHEAALSNGALLKLALMKLDPALFFGDLAPSIPILNSSTATFVSSNDEFLVNLGGKAIGSGSVARILGDAGFVDTVFGGGYVDVVLGGDGAVANVLGDGATPLILGDGFVGTIMDISNDTGLLGDGAVANILGDGYVGVILGDGILAPSSTTATVDLGGGSADVPILASSAAQTDTIAAAMRLDGGSSFQPAADVVFVTPDP